MVAYIVDTNVFNWLVDEKIKRAALPTDGDLAITHLQVDEINRISDDERRARVMLTLASNIKGVLPTETTVLDYSRLGHCKLGDGVIYKAIKADLDARNGGRKANIADALVAEVAVVNQYTLLTADRDLAGATTKLGGKVVLYSGESG